MELTMFSAISLNTRTLIRNQGEKGISDADIAYVGPHKKELAIAPRATQLTSVSPHPRRPQKRCLYARTYILRADARRFAARLPELAPFRDAAGERRVDAPLGTTRLGLGRNEDDAARAAG